MAYRLVISLKINGNKELDFEVFGPTSWCRYRWPRKWFGFGHPGLLFDLICRSGWPKKQLGFWAFISKSYLQVRMAQGRGSHLTYLQIQLA